MLLIHLSLAPPEGIEQLKGPDRLLARLQIIEDTLEAERYRLEVIDVRRHLVHCSAEGSINE